MYGIPTTRLSDRGSALTPIANVAAPNFRRIGGSDANYAAYRSHLRKTMDEPLAVFVAG